MVKKEKISKNVIVGRKKEKKERESFIVR